MAKNKKQHYVPKFYLRQFSNNVDETHIGLLIKDSNKIIRNAELKNQAYENYFYGEDGVVENGFSDIENKVAIILSNIKTSQCLPTKQSEEHFNLWLFTLLQAVRTKNSVRETNEMTNAMLQKIMSKDERFKDMAGKVEMELNNPVLFNLQIAIDGLHIAADLETKLIINRTPTPFITSDHPVVQYNQFLEKRRHPFYSAGLAVKGLQIFYPLTPNLMLLMYDSKVYRIKNRKRNFIETNEPSDINQLNILQLVNSDELIFFNQNISDFYITNLLNQNKKLLDEDTVSSSEFPERKNPDGTYSQTIHIARKGIKTKLELSFMKLTDNAKNYVMTGYVVELRDERMRKRENRRGITADNR